MGALVIKPFKYIIKDFTILQRLLLYFLFVVLDGVDVFKSLETPGAKYFVNEYITNRKPCFLCKIFSRFLKFGKVYTPAAKIP